MYTCEEQDIVSLVDSICEVLMDEDLQDLYDYKWGCITKKVQFQALPKLITKSLNEKDFLELENTEQVLRLRKAVRDMWPSLQNETERYDLLSWIVRKWGRIPHINDETLMTYVALICKARLSSSAAQKARDELYKMDRISNKSKCLAFVDPENWFVYDSRVAMALDMIIQNMPRKYEWEFILPEGRSNEAKHFGHKNPAIAGYSDYCRLIKMVAKKMEFEGVNRQCVEMKLFMLGNNLDEFKNRRRFNETAESPNK